MTKTLLILMFVLIGANSWAQSASRFPGRYTWQRVTNPPRVSDPNDYQAEPWVETASIRIVQTQADYLVSVDFDGASSCHFEGHASLKNGKLMATQLVSMGETENGRVLPPKACTLVVSKIAAGVSIKDLKDTNDSFSACFYTCSGSSAYPPYRTTYGDLRIAVRNSQFGQ